jgi:hypothetical protein
MRKFVKYQTRVTAGTSSGSTSRQYKISRTRQDDFVGASKQKAEAAAPGLR